jgi:NADP-dependent 3-hydroxy acid dehydrogenase YdfG
MSYQDKVIWITGASSGIGAALAQEFASRGAKLALSGRNLKALEALKASMPTETKLYPFDVTDKAANQQAVTQIVQDFGRIDLAVLNAGISHNVDLNHFQDAFEPLMQINFFGVVYGIDALLKAFLPINQGHIAVISSIASLGGLPASAAYCSSKAALKIMMESLQIDLAKTKIKTSIIYPGFIKTPLTDQHDFKMPFIMSSEKAAKIMADRLAKQQAQIYFPRFFAFLVRALNVLPNAWYVKVIQRMKCKA